MSVCSFPCLEVFDKQAQSYKSSVLNSGKIRVVLEASNDKTWYKYLSAGDEMFGIENFGVSANMEDLDRHFGYNPIFIAKRIKNLLSKNK